MSDKAGKSTGFRPWPKTAERLDYAEKLGINRSELINQVLEDHLREKLQSLLSERKKEIQTALATPIP